MSDARDREPRQNMEQIVSLAKGDKGDRGEPGESMTRGARNAGIFLIILTLLIGGLNVLFTGREVNNLRQAVLTECKFDADIGSAPVVVSPSSGKPSLLGVTIISDSRVSWHGHHCPGKLAAPAPSFAHWARAFHLPVG